MNRKTHNNKLELRKTRYPCLFFGLVMLPVFFLQHTSFAQVISLDSVLTTIDKQNPMLRTFESRFQAQNAYAAGATSWMPPMAGGGTFMMPYPGQKEMESRDKGFWMLSFEQNIPNPAKLHANKIFLQSKAAVETEKRAYAFNSLRAEAKANYYAWLVLEKKMKVLSQNKKLVEIMKKLAEIRYTYNQNNLGNIYKVEGRLHALDNMILMTHADIEAKSFRLKALMNIPAGSTIMIDTTTVIDFAIADVAQDTINLNAQRSDLNQINKSIQSMRYDIRLQNAQRKPEFKIRYDHMSPLSGGTSGQFTLMGMVSIPIAPWSSRMYKAEAKGIALDIQAMQEERQAILIEARGMVAGLTVQLKSLQQQIFNYTDKIIPALNRNYQTMMLAYQENRETLPNVMGAWEALNMVQLEYLDKLNTYYQLIVNYEKEIEK